MRLQHGSVGCVVLLIASACGGHASPRASAEGNAGAGGVAGAAALTFPPDTLNGTRLRARYWVSEDGARDVDVLEPSGATPVWYDAKLETPCTFQVVDDHYTCLPVTPFVVVSGYDDPECASQEPFATEAVRPLGGLQPATSLTPALRAAFCSRPQYALGGADGNPYVADYKSNPLVYELGEPAAVTSWYSTRSVGTCLLEQAHTGAHGYAVARQVDAGDLVQAHTERVDTGHRLSAVELVADDGARQHLGWYDTKLEAPCSVQLAFDGQLRCVPEITATLTVGGPFPDPVCQATAGYFEGDQAPELGDFVTAVVASGPAPLYRVVGPTSDGRSVGGLPTCQGGGQLIEGLQLFALAEVPPNTLDIFGEFLLGGGRLRPRRLVDNEGAVDRAPGTMWDSSSERDCVFALTADGQGRCLPAWDRGMFGDAGCAEPLGVNAARSEAEPPPVFAALWQGDVCTGGLALFELGSAVNAPEMLSYQDTAGNCVEDDDVGLFGDTEFYQFGSEVPVAPFASGTLRVE